jgi:hypothetical protein
MMINRIKSPIPKDSRETKFFKNEVSHIVGQNVKNTYKSSKFVPNENFLRPTNYNNYNRDYEHEKYSSNNSKF